MSQIELVDEIRRFVLSFGEHDPDCPGTDATLWQAQRDACVCGFAPRLDERMLKLEQALFARNGTA